MRISSKFKNNTLVIIRKQVDIVNGRMLTALSGIGGFLWHWN